MPEAARWPTGAPEMGRFFLLGPSTGVALHHVADMPNCVGSAYCEGQGDRAGRWPMKPIPMRTREL